MARVDGTFDTFHTSLSGTIDLNGCDDQQCNATWQRADDMIHGRIRHHLTLLPDGSIFCSGGSDSDENSDAHEHGVTNRECELYDPDTDSWSTMATMQEERMYHSTALLLPDGRVLSAGSGQGSDTNENITMAEIYSPPYLFSGKPRPVIEKAPDLVFYRDHFRIDTPDASKIGKVSLVRLAAVTHAFDENQRLVPLSFVDNGDHLDVTAPDNATYAPPGYYMLFLIAKDSEGGVPSIARYVRVPFPKTVWVDFNYAGVEEGTFAHPFDTMAEGIDQVQPGGLLRVKTGTTIEMPAIKKPMIIRSYAGSAEVGEP